MNCQWIGNNPTLRPMCCNNAVEGRSYCEEHLWMVYEKGSARARRKKDERIAAAVWDIASDFNEIVAELEMEETL